MKVKNETQPTADEAIQHAERAMDLLRKSVALHKLENLSAIENSVTREAAIELTRQAIAEAEKAAALQKESLGE